MLADLQRIYGLDTEKPESKPEPKPTTTANAILGLYQGVEPTKKRHPKLGGKLPERWADPANHEHIT